MKLYVVTEDKKAFAIFSSKADAEEFISHIAFDLGTILEIEEIEHTELMLSQAFQIE